jgi:hypothetical protein
VKVCTAVGGEVPEAGGGGQTRSWSQASKQASKQGEARRGEARLNVTRRAVSLSCEAIIEQFAAARRPMFDSADGEEASWSLQNNLPSSESEATSMIAGTSEWGLIT